MQKQAVEIKSDMLLAESRRVIEEKDVSLKLDLSITTDFHSFIIFGISVKHFFSKYSSHSAKNITFNRYKINSVDSLLLSI
jgi:hypothetical protein